MFILFWWGDEIIHADDGGYILLNTNINIRILIHDYDHILLLVL